MAGRPKLPKKGEWVHVKWEDACHYQGWAPRGGYPWRPKPTESVGVVVQANRKQVCIAQCVSHGDSGERDVSDVEVIPMSCVTRIKRFRP